jgi:hypothetical protein
MAESESSSAGIVAIFAIMLLLMIGAFIAWQAGVFSSGGSKKSLDVNVNTGQVTN